MSELPTGTVTFLFTDIEGSTRLLQRLGDAYREVLEQHGQLVRRAIQDHRGVEVSTEGDAFFAVFAEAPQALRAAVAAQRAVASCPWPEGAGVRVRMGLHSGLGALGGDNYVGLDVHRAARIASAGHGGQVLVSKATRALVEHALPEGVGLRDLGEHRLKDLAHPERLYQLVVPGQRRDFPALRTLESTAHELPLQLTSFVGREGQLSRAIRLLASTRLLTFTGPGGTGKTRLALQVAAEAAEDFAQGVFFVPLAPVNDPELVASAIASTLHLTQTSGSPLGHLEEYLNDKQVLLVLDNFEHVLAAAAQVARLLRAASRLKVVVTSRAPLHLSGEQELPVPPLELPDPRKAVSVDAVAASEAVTLFVERASATRPDFRLTQDNAAAVAEITARLDGLPLAIELAAARVKLLTPERIAARLQDRLGLLVGGPRDAPERQQTLRHAIGWSYELLDPTARRLLGQLSVFRGGVCLDQVQAVCDSPEELGGEVLEALGVLVDQSLLRQEEAAGKSRFFMLESIREFAAERLDESGQTAEIRRRHATAYLRLAEQAEPLLLSWEQARWLDRLEREHDNLRAALSWALEKPESDVALRLVWALWRFWQIRGHLQEAAERVPAVLALAGGEPRHRAKALEAAGGIAHWRGDLDEAADCYQQSLELMRQLGDRAGVANALYNRAGSRSDPDPQEVGGLLQESLTIYRQLGVTRGWPRPSSGKEAPRSAPDKRRRRVRPSSGQPRSVVGRPTPSTSDGVSTCWPASR